MALTDKITAIADKIRYYTGESEKMTLEGMSEKIDTLLNAFTGDRQGGQYLFYQSKSAIRFPKIDTSRFTTFYWMYARCENAISFPEIDTSNGTNFEYMYAYTYYATEFPKALNTSNGTTLKCMFADARSMPIAPDIDTSNNEFFNGMFRTNNKLVTIPRLNLTKATNVSEMFSGCSQLVNVTFEGEIPISLVMSVCQKLSTDSAISAITHLKNYKGTDNEFVHTITFHANVKNALIALGDVSPNNNTWVDYIGDLGWNC